LAQELQPLITLPRNAVVGYTPKQLISQIQPRRKESFVKIREHGSELATSALDKKRSMADNANNYRRFMSPQVERQAKDLNTL